ncbi:MAG TPA: hypothetical protein VM580_21010 [Labilithrix sp.]|nr:hypothetical protein [Labilithrix sp.]
MRTQAFSFVTCLSLLLAAQGTAEAQEASRAQALFDEGRRLMAEGRYADACPKLAASQKLDPGAGTLMNLASCYEKNRQLASAWATFREASSAARVSNHPDWEVAARTRADQLEPDLPRLTVIVPPDARLDGLVIDRDGRDLDTAEWDAASPIDTGGHTIRARAPGKLPWSTRVNVDGAGARAEVTIPRLESAPEDAKAARSERPSDAAPRAEWSSQRVLGIVLASAGAAGLAAGGVLGLVARANHDAALGYCNAARQCERRGLELDETASAQADASTIAFVAGGALVLGGAVVYLTGPRSKRSAARPLHLSFGAPGRVGVNLGGSF